MQYTARFASLAALLFATLVASCGGSAGDGSAFQQPQTAVDQATCSQSAGSLEAGYHFIDGVCTRTFAPMYAQVAGIEVARPLQSPHAQPVYTWAQLLAWAESTYPQYFGGGSQNGTISGYTYRYYPSTGNYLGLRTGTDMVYVTGNVTDGDVLYIGTLSALSCTVYPANCIATTPSAPAAPSAPAISQYPTVTAWATGFYSQYFSGTTQDGVEDGYAYRRYSSGNYVAVKAGRVYVLGPATGGVLKDAGTTSAPSFPTTSTGGSTGSTGTDIPGSIATTMRLTVGVPTGSTIEVGGDQDWFAITLVAGGNYIFDLSGATGGLGTLADPILRLLDASGREIARNDDVSYPSNRDSQITYTPTVGGTYYLSAQGYSTQLGTYMLQGRGPAGTTGGTGTGTGSGSGGGAAAVRYYVAWVQRESSVVNPPYVSYYLELCSITCTRTTMGFSMRGSGYSSLYSGTISKPAWNGNREVTSTIMDEVSRDFNAMLTALALQAVQPTEAELVEALGTAMNVAYVASPATVTASRLRSMGFPTGYTPGSVSGTGGTTGGTGTGTGGGTGGISGSCTPYSGPLDDPQVHVYCQAAYSHMCNNDPTNQARMCGVLTSVLSTYGSRQTAAQYCSAYCR